MAEKFIKHTGLVVPLDAANVDTDAIIPKQFLQKVTRTGFGAHLFNDWRFLDDKGQQPNPDFVLNFPQYKGASILLARENFGCGSSREQAPGVLKALGVQAVIAKSFARIFFRNAINIGLPAIVCKDLPDEVKTGDTMILHMSEGTAEANGKTYSCTKLPEYMQNILNQGGLIASLNREEEK